MHFDSDCFCFKVSVKLSWGAQAETFLNLILSDTVSVLAV